MPSFSQAIIVGNLTRDPELRYTPKGAAVCELSVAVNRRWSQDGQSREEVSYFDCVAWNKTAEVAAEYLKKGRSVFIAGELRQERWESEGQKKSRVKIHIARIQFLGAPSQGGGQSAPPDEAPVEDSNVPF